MFVPVTIVGINAVYIYVQRKKSVGKIIMLWCNHCSRKYLEGTCYR